MHNGYLQWAFVLGACVVFSGCGEQPPLNDLSGTVTYNGKPLPNFELSFLPKEGRPGNAVTDDQGRFEHVMYNEKRNGLLTGEYQVLVHFIPTEPPKIPGEPPEIPEQWHSLLRKYGNYQEPALQITIEEGQKTLQLDLKD